MKTQLTILNCLRSDFKKFADSNEPNSWELDINEIGRKIGYAKSDDLTVSEVTYKKYKRLAKDNIAKKLHLTD